MPDLGKKALVRKVAELEQKLREGWCLVKDKKSGNELFILDDPPLEPHYHQLMNLLKRSRMNHGSCATGACTACKASMDVQSLIEMYKGGMKKAQFRSESV